MEFYLKHFQLLISDSAHRTSLFNLAEGCDYEESFFIGYTWQSEPLSRQKELLTDLEKLRQLIDNAKPSLVDDQWKKENDDSVAITITRTSG